MGYIQYGVLFIIYQHKKHLKKVWYRSSSKLIYQFIISLNKLLIILYIAIQISDFKVAIISCTNSYLLLWQIYNEQRDGKTESVCYLCAWTCRLSRKTTLASSNKMISMSILLQKLWKLQTAELMLTSENMCFPLTRLSIWTC